MRDGRHQGCADGAACPARSPIRSRITLPKGERPAFPLARESLDETHAMAGIVKDAGDDPDGQPTARW